MLTVGFAVCLLVSDKKESEEAVTEIRRNDYGRGDATYILQAVIGVNGNRTQGRIVAGSKVQGNFFPYAQIGVFAHHLGIINMLIRGVCEKVIHSKEIRESLK